MDIKVISRNVGQALLISALFMFFSLIVSVVNGKDSALGPLAISFIITFVSSLSYSSERPRPYHFRTGS